MLVGALPLFTCTPIDFIAFALISGSFSRIRGRAASPEIPEISGVSLVWSMDKPSLGIWD